MPKLLNRITAEIEKIRNKEIPNQEIQYTYDDAMRAILSSNLGSLEKESYGRNDIVRKDLDYSYYAGIVKICSKKISGVKKGLVLAIYLGKYSNK